MHPTGPMLAFELKFQLIYQMFSGAFVSPAYMVATPLVCVKGPLFHQKVHFYKQKKPTQMKVWLRA